MCENVGDAHLSYQHPGYVCSQCSKFYRNLIERVKVETEMWEA